MSRRLAFVLGCLTLLGCVRDRARPPQEPPPFAVRDDARGLLLSYADAEGIHTVERVEDVPRSARAHVRVDSLTIEPEQRLDARFVWVADLRSKQVDGSYPVRTVMREEFESLAAGGAVASGSGDVIIYGASWCGVCRQAEAYFRDKGIAFIERDIEREPGARDEMIRKARAAGVSTNGIPVIDVRGTILAGFDRRAIEQALR